MRNWTKEPWDYEFGDIEDGEESHVCNIFNKDTKESAFRIDVGNYFALDVANGRRIVDCVNALAGIEDVEKFIGLSKAFLNGDIGVNSFKTKALALLPKDQ